MSRMNIWIGCLLAAALLAPGSAASAQTVPTTLIDPAGFDNIGDSGLAPDIGKLQTSVAAVSNLPLITAGTWLNRSDLPASERVAWQIDSGAGGEPTYGGDYLVLVDGRDGAPDVWSTWRWVDGGWVAYSFPVLDHSATADGRLYWRTYWSSGSPLGLRALALHTEGTTTWVDRTPDSTQPNLIVPLAPHGDVDPLAGCSYDGGCVGGASTVSPFGPGPNSVPTHTPNGSGGSGGSGPGGNPGPTVACTNARRSLARVRRQLSRAR